MAREITQTLSFSVRKGNDSASIAISSLKSDWTGVNRGDFMQTVSHTAHEALEFPGDVSTAGQCIVRNMDDTNAVKVGLQVGGNFEAIAEIPPADFAKIPLATLSVFAKAVTAPVRIRVIVLEK